MLRLEMEALAAEQKAQMQAVSDALQLQQRSAKLAGPQCTVRLLWICLGQDQTRGSQMRLQRVWAQYKASR